VQSVVQSKSGRWSGLFKQLGRAPVIPNAIDSSLLSPEARAFKAEMLAPRVKTTSAPSPRGPSFNETTAGCHDVHGSFDYYWEEGDQWITVEFDFEECDDPDGGDVFAYVIAGGYDEPPHVVVDANIYEITALDSVTFTAEVISNTHLPPVGWSWTPAGGTTWDPLTKACLEPGQTCRIQLHGTGTMAYTVQDPSTGENIQDELQIVVNLPPDVGVDDGDADLPSNWDTGGASGSMINQAEGDSISLGVLRLGEWVYTQGCAQCTHHPPTFAEPAVDPTSHYGDCTDFTQAAIKQVLGTHWPHQKINTSMFDTLSASLLATHGFVEVTPPLVEGTGVPTDGEVVVRGKTTGRRNGHAGIFVGYAAGTPLRPLGWANNGSPATDSTANQDRETGLRDFSPITGYATRFFAPVKSSP